MSFLGSLFGQTKVTSTMTPQLQDIINQLQNYDPGLGAAGQFAKHNLKLMRNGQFSELPEVAYAQAQGAKNWQNLQRSIQMSTATMPGDQAGLRAGLLMKGQLSNQDNTGHQALGAAANAAQYYGNMFNMAKNMRTQAGLQGLLGAGNLIQGSQHVTQQQGILGQLAGAAGAVAPFFNHASSPSGGGYSDSPMSYPSPIPGTYSGGGGYIPS